MLARSLIKISLICEVTSLVCLQTAAAFTSGATKGLAIRGPRRSRIACYILVMPDFVSLIFKACLHDSPAETWPRKAPTASSCWRGSKTQNQLSKTALRLRLGTDWCIHSYHCAVLRSWCEFHVPRQRCARD